MPAFASLPFWCDALLYLATLWALFFLRRATSSWWPLIILVLWGAAQWLMAANGFYLHAEAMPPRPLFLLLPAVIVLVVLIATAKGRAWLRSTSLADLALLSALRVPIEIMLHQAYLQGQVPRMMTFEGLNFDILSGITAPMMYAYINRHGRHPDRRVLLAWNLVCLALLLNVVSIAVLSAPSPLQRLNFDAPNQLVLQAPYVLLPVLVVPLVLWSHTAALVKLLSKQH